MSPEMNPFTEKNINLFCDILDHYKNTNEDTRFFVLFNRREFSTKIKFKVLSDILVNLFVSPKVKGVLLELFCKTQRVYSLLSRFAHRYQVRKAKVRVDTDLCLNTIDIQHRKTIPVFDKQTRSVFLFTCADLVNILMTALTHSSNFFVEPRVCKNPYTNMPFPKSVLYSIYFHIQNTYPVVPPLLQSFFMCHFDTNVFLLHNEHAIRSAAVKNYLKNSSIRTLSLEVFHMLHLVHSHFSIDTEFPDHMLVDIMRPYLYLYLMFMYSIHGSEQRGVYYILLKKKMQDFWGFNKNFGRKRVERDRQIHFNWEYPNFTMKHIHDILQTKQYMQWYSYWNTWDIPTPYASQLSRLNTYSPSLYRTDVDYDEDDDEYDLTALNTAANTNVNAVNTTSVNATPANEDDDSSSEEEEEECNNNTDSDNDDELYTISH